MRAVLDAVQADEALALAEVGVRVGRPLAALDAEVAVGAADRVAVDPPEREPAEDPEQGPERADRPAEEPGDPPVGDQEADEDQADDPRLPVFAGLVVDPLGRLVDRRQDARRHRPDGQRDRVEQADLQRAVAPLVLLGRLRRSRCRRREDPRDARLPSSSLPLIGLDDLAGGIERRRDDPEAGHREHRGQDVILDRVDLPVAVDLDDLLGVPAVADPAEEVVQDAERAHPVAPDPAEHHRDRDDHQAPDEVPVDRMGRQRRATATSGVASRNSETGQPLR